MRKKFDIELKLSKTPCQLRKEFFYDKNQNIIS